jgi:hypothetical protein
MDHGAEHVPFRGGGGHGPRIGACAASGRARCASSWKEPRAWVAGEEGKVTSSVVLAHVWAHGTVPGVSCQHCHRLGAPGCFLSAAAAVHHSRGHGGPCRGFTTATRRHGYGNACRGRAERPPSAGNLSVNRAMPVRARWHRARG